MRLCTVLYTSLGSFCREVNEDCLPCDKNDKEKNVHKLQLAVAWIRS